MDSNIACWLSRSIKVGVALVSSVVEEHRGLAESALRTTKRWDSTACDRMRAPFAIGTQWLRVRTVGAIDQLVRAPSEANIAARGISISCKHGGDRSPASLAAWSVDLALSRPHHSSSLIRHRRRAMRAIRLGWGELASDSRGGTNRPLN